MIKGSEITFPSIGFRPAAPRNIAGERTPAVGKFERLPKWLNCIPLIMQWLWLSICYRNLTLPSAINPTITSGGMVGEGKLEYFESMGDVGKNFLPSYVGIMVSGNNSLEKTLHHMRDHNLDFPVVAKPNLGWCGYGVRKITSLMELENYLKGFPVGETVVLQKYLPQASEAGLYYVRNPDEERGRVTGITLRYFPQVTGDGIHTIRQLMVADLRLQRVVNNKLHKPEFDPELIPAQGEKIRLSVIGSTRVGGLYRDGSDYITQKLSDTVDAIARDMNQFYVGRFDVRFNSLEELQGGKGFMIMEVNGSGAESVHAWDPKYSIIQSYRIIFAKQRLIFKLGSLQRRKGHKPIGWRELARLYLYQQELIRRYPLSN